MNRFFKKAVRLRRRIAAAFRGVDPREFEGPSTPWKMNPRVQNFIDETQFYTQNDPLRISLLYGLAREIHLCQMEGDVVECGVCRGGSAGVMASVITADPNRRLWLYDVFEGMPAPGPQDHPLAKKEAGRFVVGTEHVLTLLKKISFPADRIVLRQGLFHDTFSQPLPDKIALLHIDADWYDSVLSALRTFYPRVVTGGWVVLDDFGHWEGCRKAFYAFCRENRLEPLLERAGYTQAFWRKGHETNRDLAGRYSFGIYRPQGS